MDRREFLKALGMGATAAAVISVTPGPVYRAAARWQARRVISDDFSIDFTNRQIRYMGSGETYTVQELYAWLMDEWSDDG